MMVSVITPPFADDAFVVQRNKRENRMCQRLGELGKVLEEEKRPGGGSSGTTALLI